MTEKPNDWVASWKAVVCTRKVCLFTNREEWKFLNGEKIEDKDFDLANGGWNG